MQTGTGSGRNGYFGDYGGRFAAETLQEPLRELELAYGRARRDPAFRRELEELLRSYVGRPTPLYHARRLSKEIGGAEIYLKREDLCHTGAHKINNCLGQALLARKTGKRRVIAEISSRAVATGLP
nr:pyridoxal-phosphate dependent enzyme [bacterium]